MSPVRLFLLALALVPLGCIYTDGINRPPALEVKVETPTVYVGDEVVISAQNSTDPDGDSLTFEWSLEWRPLPGRGGGDIPSPQPCPRSVPENKYCFVPQAKAIYDVRLTVTDRWGASRSTPEDEPIEISVNNRAPVAVLDVVTVGNEFGQFTAGREILLYAGNSSDEDAGDVLSFTWTVDVPQASLDAFWQTLDSDGASTEDASEAVFLRLVPDVQGSYRVTVRVDDGSGGIEAACCDSADRDLFVVEDRAPCVTGTAPDWSLGALVFDRTEVRRLEVTHVADDLDFYPGGPHASFRWSVSSAPGEPFAPVSGYSYPYLDVDGAAFDLGQVIRVRVIPEDRVDRPAPGCPESQTTCGADCFEWVTWEIEFR